MVKLPIILYKDHPRIGGEKLMPSLFEPCGLRITPA